MRKYLLILAASLTVVTVTACGSSDVVINGTTAAESSAVEVVSTYAEGSQSDEERSGTKIEIVTVDTEPAAESMEGQTEPETTAAETEATTTAAAATTAASTTAAPTTAAATYTVTPVDKTMYATSSVRVRASYSTSSDVIGSLGVGQSVKVTGESSNGWMQVSYNGQTAYVSKSYLSDTPVATTAAAENTSSTTSTTSTTTSSTGTGPTATTTTTTTAASETTASATTSSSSSVTGTVSSLDPSGLTVQTSGGQTYRFTWGSNVSAVSPGDSVVVQYVTDSSGNMQITQISK